MEVTPEIQAVLDAAVKYADPPRHERYDGPLITAVDRYVRSHIPEPFTVKVAGGYGSMGGRFAQGTEWEVLVTPIRRVA